MADIIISKCTKSSPVFSSRPVTALFILLLTLLSGCIPVTERSLAPMDFRRIFPCREKFLSRPVGGSTSRMTPLPCLSLQALTDNFSLHLARERIEEARAIARQTGASLIAYVDGQGTISSIRNYQENTSSENFLLGLAASYEIDLWGRLRNQRDAAVLDAQATEADYHTAAISLAAEVAIIWYQLVESDCNSTCSPSKKKPTPRFSNLSPSNFEQGKSVSPMYCSSASSLKAISELWPDFAPTYRYCSISWLF